MMTLLAQVNELRQQVDQLAELFASLQNPLLEHVVARTEELESAIRALPTAPDALRWWLWHSEAHLIRNLLTPVQGYTRLMHIQPAQLGLASYSAAEDAQFERINAQATELNETLTQYVDQMRSLYRTEAETLPQAVRLHAALEAVWPILRYSLRETAVVLVPQIDLDLPPVLYHRLHTTALLQHLVAVMGREWMAFGPLVMSAQAEATHVALRLAAKGLRVSEAQWSSLFKNAGDEVYYKRLTAMGGDLTPIAPQGTHEGGLIVHLPWARPVTEADAEA